MATCLGTLVRPLLIARFVIGQTWESTHLGHAWSSNSAYDQLHARHPPAHPFSPFFYPKPPFSDRTAINFPQLGNFSRFDESIPTFSSSTRHRSLRALNNRRIIVDGWPRPRKARAICRIACNLNIASLHAPNFQIFAYVRGENLLDRRKFLWKFVPYFYELLDRYKDMYRVANVLCFFIILKMWKFKKLYAHPYPEPNYNSEIRSFPRNISKKLNYCFLYEW